MVWVMMGNHLCLIDRDDWGLGHDGILIDRSDWCKGYDEK